MAFAIYTRNPFSYALRQAAFITKKLLQRPAMLGLFTQSACAVAFSVEAADTKPNIVIIWGDDIGQSNISALASDRDRSLVAVYKPARNNQVLTITIFNR